MLHGLCNIVFVSKTTYFQKVKVDLNWPNYEINILITQPGDKITSDNYY